MMHRPRVLVIDNYDSFTYNLVQQLEELDARVVVRLCDRIGLDDVARLLPDAVVISPGPCTPHEAGISVPLIRRYAGILPILGVCLGHQAIGVAFGGRVIAAERVMHGRTSLVHHDAAGVFADLPNPFEAMRYHSLVVDPATVPDELQATAWTEEHELMGIRHRAVTVEGVQFHPESILTPLGSQLVRNFLARVVPHATEART